MAIDNLNNYLVVKSGSKLNIKDFKNGAVTVHKNGKKTYSLNCISNLDDKKDYILIGAMSCKMNYINKDDTKNHFVGKGCFSICLNDEGEKIYNLKYVYFFLKLYVELETILKNKRHGSLQQFINKKDLLDTLNEFCFETTEKKEKKYIDKKKPQNLPAMC